MTGQPQAMVAIVAGLALLPAAALAFDPVLPDATVAMADEAARRGRLNLPVAGFDGTRVPTEAIEGVITRRAWRINDGGDAHVELFRTLAEAAAAQGYQVVLDCDAQSCGGFDFRFAIDVLREPAMHVDLDAFGFLSARRPGGPGPEAMTLLVSRTSSATFVQIVTLAPAGAGDAPPPAADLAPDALPPPILQDARPEASGDAGAAPPGEWIAMLTEAGTAVLEGIDFAPGSSVLDTDAPGLSRLDALAAWLAADAARRIAIVGHTDASGSLAGNAALARARAAAIRDHLTGALGADGDQVVADGVGALAPRATNATEEGRRLNRRVEVVLLPEAAD
jgi:outer membrane protein OmpA-like peptidoglycan-associated protein